MFSLGILFNKWPIARKHFEITIRRNLSAENRVDEQIMDKNVNMKRVIMFAWKLLTHRAELNENGDLQQSNCVSVIWLFKGWWLLISWVIYCVIKCRHEDELLINEYILSLCVADTQQVFAYNIMHLFPKPQVIKFIS